jgi:hypothetical protein
MVKRLFDLNHCIWGNEHSWNLSPNRFLLYILLLYILLLSLIILMIVLILLGGISLGLYIKSGKRQLPFLINLDLFAKHRLSSFLLRSRFLEISISR